MNSQRLSQVFVVVTFLPGGFGALWFAGSMLLEMMAQMRELAPVVIIHRGALAAVGAGIGLLGAGWVVVAGDFLKSDRMMRWAGVMMAAGALLTLALPLPASFLAGRVLERAGYAECPELTAFSFCFSRVAWVRDSSRCVRPTPPAR